MAAVSAPALRIRTGSERPGPAPAVVSVSGAVVSMLAIVTARPATCKVRKVADCPNASALAAFAVVK